MHDESAPAALDARSPSEEVTSASVSGGGTAPEGNGVRTGHAAVDAVLSDVERLSEVEVSEHVAVFERAHDTLRQALDVGTDD